VKEPFLISRQEVEFLHHQSLVEHGGQDGIRDEHVIRISARQLDKIGLAALLRQGAGDKSPD
jgi:hypothetical protein